MVTVLLRNIDLNLLVVLDALLTEKHVTRTGARVHVFNTRQRYQIVGLGFGQWP